MRGMIVLFLAFVVLLGILSQPHTQFGTGHTPILPDAYAQPAQPSFMSQLLTGTLFGGAQTLWLGLAAGTPLFGLFMRLLVRS
jgi:hypothetical protein